MNLSHLLRSLGIEGDHPLTERRRDGPRIVIVCLLRDTVLLIDGLRLGLTLGNNRFCSATDGGLGATEFLAERFVESPDVV